ncbi:MAG: hypothetical protein L0226_10070 [Acidobacteria bacterium]|nr:hypothetical protein [Acidobacteriota bacterium]
MKSKKLAQKQILGLIQSLLIITLAGYAQQRSETDAFRSDQSVFIVTWKKRGYYDRDLMEKLHRNLSERARVQSSRQDNLNTGRPMLDRSHSERKTLDRPTPFILPGGGSDEELKMKVEEQFRKQKRLRLVDSAEKADLVFLVQGEYIFRAITRVTGGGGSFAIAGEENGPNALARLKAVAVPASDYQDRPSRLLKLMEIAPWRGEEIGAQNYDATFEEASAEKLVKRFHKEALKK